jgi:hypothetical protein
MVTLKPPVTAAKGWSQEADTLTCSSDWVLSEQAKDLRHITRWKSQACRKNAYHFAFRQPKENPSKLLS